MAKDSKFKKQAAKKSSNRFQKYKPAQHAVLNGEDDKIFHTDGSSDCMVGIDELQNDIELEI